MDISIFFICYLLLLQQVTKKCTFFSKKMKKNSNFLENAVDKKINKMYIHYIKWRWVAEMNAAVAQSVEHRTENPYVDSSILSRGKPERLSLSGFFLPKSIYPWKSVLCKKKCTAKNCFQLFGCTSQLVFLVFIFQKIIQFLEVYFLCP